MIVRGKEQNRWYGMTCYLDTLSLVGNKWHPCLHADPFFPDLNPGERAEIRGRLLFFDGSLDDFTTFIREDNPDFLNRGGHYLIEKRRIHMIASRLAAAVPAAVGARVCESIPPKAPVLLFDDALKSHLTVIASMLGEYDLGATFFVTHAWMNDTEHFMTWEEGVELHQMGFKIGNYTGPHADMNTPRNLARLTSELALVENELARAGVPKPISFGWPGNSSAPESVAILEKAGDDIAGEEVRFRAETQPLVQRT